MSRYQVSFWYDEDADFAQLEELQTVLLRVFANEELFDPQKFTIHTYYDRELMYEMVLDSPIECTPSEMQAKKQLFEDSIWLNPRYVLKVIKVCDEE